MRSEPTPFDPGPRRSSDAKPFLTPRIRLGLFLGVVAAIGAGAIVGWGRPWLRVFIAPAWRAGTEVSRLGQAPNFPVVIMVAFVLGFALGFFGWPAIRSRQVTEHGLARTLAINLVTLYAVVAFELARYPAIGGHLLESVGRSGAMGSEYPLVLARLLLPGALSFLTLATIAAYWTLRRRPGRTYGVLSIIWVAHVFLLLASVAWYSSPAGPASS
jgi:hypothetical protein